MSTAIGAALTGVCVSGSALVGGTDGARSDEEVSETIMMGKESKSNGEISRGNGAG